jgi:hypothetical protein
MADELSNKLPNPQKEKRENATAGAKDGEAEIRQLRGLVDGGKSDPQAADDQERRAKLQSPHVPVAANDSQSSDAGAHPAYYSEVVFVEEDNRLDFTRAAGSQVPPTAYRELRRQIDDVARLVRVLFQDDKTRLAKFFEELHLTADSGLRGANSSLEIGADNLQDVKNHIADEFPAVRGKIWWWNFGLLVATTAVCGLASSVLHQTTGSWLPNANANSIGPSLELAAFLIPLGVVIGLFVEFIFRVSDDVPYEQLRAINPGRWKPFQRTFNTLIVAYVFAGILGVGAFQVGVASVLLNDFVDKKPALSLAIGFVTGFAFPFVRDLVQQFRPVRRDSTG